MDCVSSGGSLRSVSFNQDSGCFACALEDGFRIFNTQPVRESFRRVFGSGIGIVEMLFRCNLLALVGGGANPRYPPNKVMIWDDHQNRCIGELVFKSEVRSVKLRRDRIVVALQFKVYIYRFSDLKLLDSFITADNHRGVLTVCYNPLVFTVASLGSKCGEVFVKQYDAVTERLLQAHSSSIVCLAIDNEGVCIATASDKGTLIRVWDTTSGALLHELRRGIDVANILCLAFNSNATNLICSSDKGTVHMFSTANLQTTHTNSPPVSLEKVQAVPASSNKPSYLKSIVPSFLKPNLLYLDSQWSFLQIRNLGKCICTFTSDGSRILVLCSTGTAYIYSFTPNGKAFRESTTKFCTDDPVGKLKTSSSNSDAASSETTTEGNNKAVQLQAPSDVTLKAELEEGI